MEPRAQEVKPKSYEELRQGLRNTVKLTNLKSDLLDNPSQIYNLSVLTQKEKENPRDYNQ